MALWDVQYINLRLTQTSGFNTLHNLTAFAIFFLIFNGSFKSYNVKVMTGMQIQHQAELTKVVLASFVIYVPDMFNFIATS